jgi:HSP20 family molecular chaperone IbpA
MQDERRDTLERTGRNWRVEEYVVWRGNRPFSPPTDVLEFSDRLRIIVEIAGMRAGDFNVVLLDKRIVITGVRERPAIQGAAYHQVEIGYGEFRVEVHLPWSVQREEVGASYRDGFLQIDLPRRPDTQIKVVDDNPDDTNGST